MPNRDCPFSEPVGYEPICINDFPALLKRKNWPSPVCWVPAMTAMRLPSLL